MLCRRGVLAQPLLYLSLYMKKYKAEYCQRLQEIRTHGRWEEWVGFFLSGVVEVAQGARETARKIITLRENDRARVGQHRKAAGNLLRALDALFAAPVVSAHSLSETLQLSYEAVNKMIARLVDLRILVETTGYKRNRLFGYDPYLELLSSGTELDQDVDAEAVELKAGS
jgi:Fic family protein